MDKRLQLVSYEKNMDTLFKELYEEFDNSKFRKRKDLPLCKGIYVFYENEIPIYVGRSNNIYKRIQSHTIPSAKSESASFAFNLAKNKFLLNNEIKIKIKMKRKDFMLKEEFIKSFNEHKKNFEDADFKCIEIENDILQTMFEPYLAFKLKTYPHNNTFENH